MHLYEFPIKTPRENLINITDTVQDAVGKSGVQSGLCTVYCPHTTAGITVNENADPDVVHDILIGLRTAYGEDRRYRHGEGNSPAHLKSSAVGCSQTFLIREGRLLLGTWQAIYFCEFDGPRSRRFHVSVING